MTSDAASRDTAAPPEPDAGAALWDSARDGLATFVGLFGAAADLVAVLFMRRADHSAANTFLRGLETLVRRLLVVAASRLIPTLPDFTPSPRHPPIRLPEPISDLTDPVDLSVRPQDKWPAMFCIMPPASDAEQATDSKGEPLPCRPNGPRHKTNIGAGFRSTRSIALRLEALRRVLDEPDYFIRAMAWQLKLQQKSGEAIVMRELTLSDEAAHHLDRPLARAADLALDVLARLEVRAPNTS